MIRKSTDFFRYLLFVSVSIAALSGYIYVRLNKQIIRFDPVSGPIVNPMMGWAPWATIEQSYQPHTLVYASLTWRDFEPREGYYDFNSFEKKQQLTRWRREGKRVVFRFVADVPGDKIHLDIPDWLFEKMKGRGDFYDNEYGKGFSPDYSDPILIEAHRKAIKALGERYGQDGFFAFIELGSLGHWGEWHTHPAITPLPSEETRNLYIYQYTAAFPRAHLLMRRPFPIAQALKLGLYNDMTGDPAATNTWLDWIQNGAASSSPGADGLLAMPDRWQTAPIGGEQAFDLSDQEVFGIGLEQTLGLLRRSHTTFIGPGSPYEVEYGSSLQEGIDQVLTIIGYRICLEQVQLPRWILYGKHLKVTFTFSNNGIAPMYYNWPTKLYLFDERGDTVMTTQARIDFRKVLPGELYDTTLAIPVGHLKKGTYSIGIAILDPITGKPGVKFANENAREDLIQYIGSFEVRGLFIPADTSPQGNQN